MKRTEEQRKANRRDAATDWGLIAAGAVALLIVMWVVEVLK